MTATTSPDGRGRRGGPEPLTVHNLLDRLQAVRRNGEGRWMAKCPAHGDKTASLSVRLGEDERILLHDFGGCSFPEIVAALGIEPRQLFPASDQPWRPRPRPDASAEALAFLRRLQTLRAAPSPERMRKELVLVGHLILGGTRAMAELPPGFSGEDIKTFPLRIVFQAAQELVKQGTPRRWFSPLALAREVERAERCWGLRGHSWRRDVFFWARLSVATAREDR